MATKNDIASAKKLSKKEVKEAAKNAKAVEAKATEKSAKAEAKANKKIEKDRANNVKYVEQRGLANMLVGTLPSIIETLFNNKPDELKYFHKDLKRLAKSYTLKPKKIKKND
jgi:predicted 2-oxoglutarate/Fe(II)-dependent dioxygenase YbiX